MSSILRPFQKNMTPALAQMLAKLRVDKGFQKRLNELADKNSEAALTTAEQQEYDHHLAALGFVTIMRLKAKQKLLTRNTKK